MLFFARMLNSQLGLISTVSFDICHSFVRSFARWQGPDRGVRGFVVRMCSSLILCVTAEGDGKGKQSRTARPVKACATRRKQGSPQGGQGPRGMEAAHTLAAHMWGSQGRGGSTHSAIRSCRSTAPASSGHSPRHRGHASEGKRRNTAASARNLRT